MKIDLILIAIAFLAGVGITTIGPGGIFITIALFSLTSLSSGEAAGTASALMILTGVFGSLIYFRSGELKEEAVRRLAIILSGTSIAGGFAGSQLNIFLSDMTFGALLGAVSFAVGAFILFQEWQGPGRRFRLDMHSTAGRVLLPALGFGIGMVGGLLGLGGPVLAVPALVMLGVPILTGVAVAQVQSVFIAVFATAGYMMRGTVVWPLVALVGVPLVLGLLVGWKIAHRVEPRRLGLALGIVLIVLGPLVAF